MEEVWFSSVSLSFGSAVSARKWILVLFFCPALSGCLVVSLHVGVEVSLSILLA